MPVSELVAATSPILVGSFVVTGLFDEALVITGDESEDLSLRVSFSTRDSFEWADENGDGKWQLSEDTVVEMGVRAAWGDGVLDWGHCWASSVRGRGPSRVRELPRGTRGRVPVVGFVARGIP